MTTNGKAATAAAIAAATAAETAASAAVALAKNASDTAIALAQAKAQSDVNAAVMATKIDNIQIDVTNIKETLKTKDDDHEIRLRSLEKITTQIMTWGSAAMIAIGIVEFLVSRYT